MINGLCWVHSGAASGHLDSSGSFGRASGVVGLILVCWFHAGSRRGSKGSFGRHLVVVGFIWVRWVNSGAPWGLSASFGFFGFIRVRPCGSLWFVAYIRVLPKSHRVHSGSLASFSRSLGFAGFIWVKPGGRRVHSVSFGLFGRSLGIIRFILVRCVHSGAIWVSSGSFEFVGFILGR